MARRLAGIDGCRKGWAVILVDRDDPGRHHAARCERLEDLFAGPESPDIACIDIPIGLPDALTTGRGADRAARRMLGTARASVFPVPPRPALAAGDYAEAKRLARAHSSPPRAVSIQCFNLFPAIREADALLRARPDLRPRVFEAHPELAFFRLNGERALAASKRRPEGRAARAALLRDAGLPPALVGSPPPRGIGPDDHLDAMALLVVARDIADGRALSLPCEPERDAHGLPMAIWAPACARRR